MSQIKLVSVVGFKVNPGGLPTILFGAQSVRQDPATGQFVFKIGNVPTSSQVKYPGGGLSLFYGFRETIDETAKWRKRAEAEGGEFHTAYVTIEVEEIMRNMVATEDLPGLQFATIRRAKASLIDDIADQFCGVLERETQSLKAISRVKFLAENPWLFEQLLANPPFSKLQVFVYPVLDGDEIKYFAYMKPSATIVDLEQNTQMPWRLEL